jgi:DNA recombination protein RmuC
MPTIAFDFTPTEIGRALAGALVLALILAAVLWTRLRGLHERIDTAAAAHEAAIADLRDDLERERRAVAEAVAKMEVWLAEKTQAETRLRDTERRLGEAIAERDRALRVRDDALERCARAEQDAALRRQELLDVQKRLEDWETAKAESLQAAKAAVLATATEVSSKLLDDHKREAEKVKAEGEERVRKTTEDLLRQMGEITKSIAALDKDVDRTKATMGTVWRALSSPGGAGQFAEIGLENTLKAFGLEKGRDFLIQGQVEGSRLRPDAIVFLPDETVLVVDAKASKHLLNLAAAEGGSEAAKALESLKQTMNEHLKSLALKNYREAIEKDYRDAGRGGALKRIVSVMYLPNEGALEKLKRADPLFEGKARKADIQLAGPSALHCLIGFASIQINFGRRLENEERIVEGLGSLIDAVIIVAGHTEKVGKGLKSAADNFAALTGSMNSRLLPRVRKLLELGVRPSRNQKLPRQIPAFHVAEAGGEIIDGEAEEVALLSDGGTNPGRAEP